jgi:hypothetical protein
MAHQDAEGRSASSSKKTPQIETGMNSRRTSFYRLGISATDVK